MHTSPAAYTSSSDVLILSFTNIPQSLATVNCSSRFGKILIQSLIRVFKFKAYTKANKAFSFFLNCLCMLNFKDGDFWTHALCAWISKCKSNSFCFNHLFALGDSLWYVQITKDGWDFSLSKLTYIRLVSLEMFFEPWHDINIYGCPFRNPRSILWPTSLYEVWIAWGLLSNW